MDVAVLGSSPLPRSLNPRFAVGFTGKDLMVGRGFEVVAVITIWVKVRAGVL